MFLCFIYSKLTDTHLFGNTWNELMNMFCTVPVVQFEACWSFNEVYPLTFYLIINTVNGCCYLNIFEGHSLGIRQEFQPHLSNSHPPYVFPPSAVAELSPGLCVFLPMCTVSTVVKAICQYCIQFLDGNPS